VLTEISQGVGRAPDAIRAPGHDSRALPLIGICFCLAAGLLIAEWMTPLGLNVPAFNVILVLMGIWMPWRSAALVLAIAATLLAIIGYVLSPLPDAWSAPHAPIVNRCIAIAVVWVAAVFVMLHKATQQRLAEMQDRFRETFEQTPVGIAHVAHDGTLLMSNRCLAEIMGYSDSAELGCKRLQDLVHPDDLRAHRDYVDQLINGGLRTCTLEARFFKKDGSLVWINETVTRIRDKSNSQTAYLLYVMQDISERKRTEQHLTKLRAALESANDAVAIFETGSGGAGPMIEYVNAAFSRMFGYESADVIGKSPEMLRDRGSEGSPVLRLSDELHGHESYRQEVINRRSDGHEFIAEWRVTRVRDDSVEPNHWVAIIRDMTEKHSYERALKESEKRARRQLAELETLYHTAPIGLAMFSTDLRFIRVNERLAEMNGIPPEQHMGRTPRQVVPGLTDKAETLLRQVLETGNPTPCVEVEGETLRAPGVRRTWREQFYPVFFEGTIEGVGAVIEDITEQKRGEQHLKLVMHELNHRVKNSLAVVQSMASQTVRASTSLADFEASLIGRIRALADTHTLLIESDWRFADMRKVIREAVRPYREAGGENVDIAGPELALTPSASLALSMVLHELTTNAVKYGSLSAPGGRVTIRWQVAGEESGSELLLRWAESGGPKVVKPVRAGFGSQLIDFTIKHEFGGTATIDYPETGVICEISIPWEKIALSADAAGTRSSDPPASGH
jgi:PAS domain S-box-containing protein